MSPSVGRKSSPIRSESPTRVQRSPHRRSPKSNRERSPTRHRSSHRSPIKEKENPSTSRGRSPKRPRSRSPIPHARRGNEEEHEGRRSREHHKDRHRERGTEREVLVGRRERSRSPVLHPKHRSEEDHELQRSREHHRERHSERSINREVSIDRSERRSRDKKDEVSLNSRSRHKRSASPVDVPVDDRSIGWNSGSPSRVSRSRVRNEVASPQGDDHREENDSVAIMKATAEALEAKKKEEPSFELSGKLAAETNRVRGVTLLHTEPSEARKPDIRWRLYVFKAGEALNEPLYIHRQSCYLFGRERRVADVPTDHPSCSKQHAVIQFRQVEKEKPDGMLSKQVRPYLMDLGSTNGTLLNESRIEPERYYELFEKDTIKFGNSSREYVILHENSA